MFYDLRFAFRSLARQPGFCVAAILTLALGIGANTAIFSVFDAVILRPLPYRDPGRLVLVWQKLPDGNWNPVSPVNYLEWAKQTSTFERLLGMYTQFYNFKGRDESFELLGAQVSRGFFSTLGVRLALGREFAVDEKLDSNHVALVSHGFWESHLGGDRKIIGRALNMNGESYTVLGVLPPDSDAALIFRGIDVWTPLHFDQTSRLRSNTMAVIGRLKPSSSLRQAGEEMRVVASRLESRFPDLNRGWSAMVMPLASYELDRVHSALLALLAAVGLLLLIACVNVANLLLARSQMRSKEIAVRSALGASRARLLRQLLTETMILALAGSVAGSVLAYAGLRLLLVFEAGQLPRMENAALDARALAFTVAITVLTGLLFGLLPAHHLLGEELKQWLREAGRSSIGSRTGRMSRNVLVVLEIALSLVLLSGAGVMIRSLLWLENEDRGFAPKGLLSFRVSISRSDFPNPSAMAAYYRRMLERIEETPGARAVAATTNLPLDGFLDVGQHFRVDGAAAAAPSERPSAACDLINTGYFKAAGIPILAGREFDDRDREDGARVAVISNSLARRFFAGQNPVGRRLLVASPGKAEIETVREIVGVAGDIRYLTGGADDSLEIYLPYVQTTWPTIYVMMRATGDTHRLAGAVRARLNTSGWQQSIADERDMEERIAGLNGKTRLNSLLAAIFAGIALALAGIGIYGVISYTTARRTQEIGVRMALGATRRDIVNWIVRQSMLLAAAGLAMGLAGQWALSRVLGSLLYGTSPTDAPTLAAACAVLCFIAMLASYIPARRAVQGDPLSALRAE